MHSDCKMWRSNNGRHTALTLCVKLTVCTSPTLGAGGHGESTQRPIGWLVSLKESIMTASV